MPIESTALAEALTRLYRRTAHGIRPGLEIEKALLDRMGHPEASFLTVQVAGTNGKGSVCAMIESVLRAWGFRTGIYTSPHLVDYGERIRVNGACIPGADLAALLSETEDVADRLVREAGRREATFFEVTTALAFEYFRRRKVEIAVVETGMGGIWDATNVVSPVASIVTRIDVDHTNYLGDTIERIAFEKSGIIKRGVPAVCGPMPEEALAVVRARAGAEGVVLRAAQETVSVRRQRQDFGGQRLTIEGEEGRYGPLTLPLIGRHQMENCAIAIAALEVLQEPLAQELDTEAVKAGLECVAWPGRCQVIEKDPLVMVDGAHNPCGARSLAGVLGELAGRRPVGVIASFLSDKDCAGFMRALASFIRRCWAVPIRNERAMAMDGIIAGMRAAGLEPRRSGLSEALDEARGWARAAGGMVCITGSLYLVGEILRLAGSPLFRQESDHEDSFGLRRHRRTRHSRGGDSGGPAKARP